MRCIYRAGDLVGMIAVYPYDRAFVVHWEEHRDGGHCRRAAQLRDEMHRFESADEVLAFVERAGYPATGFT